MDQVWLWMVLKAIIVPYAAFVVFWSCENTNGLILNFGNIEIEHKMQIFWSLSYNFRPETLPSLHLVLNRRPPFHCLVCFKPLVTVLRCVFYTIGQNFWEQKYLHAPFSVYKGIMMFDATFSGISVISWWPILLVEETGVYTLHIQNVHCISV
jgi:hypothetical protein